MNEGRKIESTKGAQIPDDDMIEWIKILREGKFTNEEMDAMLSGLNLTYANRSMGVEQRVAEIEKRLEEQNIKLSDQDKEKLKKYWESVLGKKQ